MTIDLSRFKLSSVIDTCSIWNVLSSRLLADSARREGCKFACTRFVLYECLEKPRTRPTSATDELKRRLVSARKIGEFEVFEISIEELDDIEIIRRRRRL